MSDRKFNKPSLAIQEQTDFLRDQGLIISDEQEALNALSFIGYYRFSGYLLPYKQTHRDGEKRTFKPNTHFSDVLELYQFDQSLRALVSTAIEKIEIAFRASLVNTTSMALGPFWYSEEKLYRNTKTYDLIMSNIEKILSNSHDMFIRHYRTQYSYPKTPPIWMIAEALSFGICSKMFNNLSSLSLRKDISQRFGHHPTIFSSWIQSLTYVRNICAHHGRLWNRWLVNSPMLPKHDLNKRFFSTTKEYRFHLIAYVIHEMLKIISPKTNWKKQLFTLFEQYSVYPGIEMGFQQDWRNDPFWEL